MRKLFTLLVAVLLTASLLAQAPEKMSYQAVIRNNSGTLVTSTQIGMEINIRQGSETGTVVYTETQTPTTNANGLVSIEIGGGAGFNTINWGTSTYFIETKTAVVAPLTTYTITGVSQLLSVPYALHAKTADNGITTAQANAIVANTAKVGYTDALVSANPDVVANTAKVGITPAQADAIVANTAKVGITTAQADAIVANTAKVGITPQQADAIVANTAKVGITTAQADAITANTAKVGITTAQADAIVANTAKVGITTAQADAIVANTAKVGITAQQASDITTNNAKVGITTAQADAIVANTAKVGITPQQADAIVANTAKVGITAQQASDITTNNAKVGITTTQANAIVANTAKVGITPQQASDITTNNAKVGITTAQADAIVANTAKVGISVAQTTKLVGIADGAEVNVQADWNQATTTSDDFIKNKPTIPTAADGSETKVTAGNNVTVTGAGTTASPYVVNATGPTTFTIGQSYQGGIIFWLDATGQHGLIADTADQGTGGIPWGNGYNSTSNAVRDGIGAGMYNTERIIANQGVGSYAAQLCANYQGGGYGDWYLPSKYELNLLYLQKTAVGGFSSASYWSSSEGDSSSAWMQNFGHGAQQLGGKNDPSYSVRAVRAF